MRCMVTSWNSNNIDGLFQVIVDANRINQNAWDRAFDLVSNYLFDIFFGN